jgi:hypothetical protein
VEGNAITLHFTALQSRSYTVQFLPDVSAARWEKLADVPAGVQRSISTPDNDSPGYTHRFYRLVTPSLP